MTLGVLGTASGAGVALLLGFSVFLTAAPLLVWAAAPDTVTLLPGDPVGSPAEALPASAAGLVGLVLAGYAAGWLAGAEAKAARLLLSPRDEGLSTRVIELTRSRARLIDAFEAERRRIERDLHDGAQQQLVALSMTLGTRRDAGAGRERPRPRAARPGTRRGPARPGATAPPGP